MSQNKVFLTKEGIEKLRNEIHHLKTVEQRECLEAISDARGGDPSENTEYDVAKENYENLNIRLSKLNAILANTTLIDIESISNDTVQILTTVSLKNIKTNRELSYTIVPEFEVNIRESKISVSSPVGKSLIGKRVGECVKIKLPSNETIELEILDIKL
jgi:transcription elongation factor GreA